MCLTMKGQIIANTLTDRAINTLVQCAESIIIPPLTSTFIKSKVPKILKVTILKECLPLNLSKDINRTFHIVTHMKVL